eukprot:15220259-Ditylum_brightwellii.AAC.1
MEELNGLLRLGVFDEISEAEYCHFHSKGAASAIPAMCILNVKHDAQGRPICAKSCIVVLGNLEQRSWDKIDVYAPVITQAQVCLLTSFAVSSRRVLKQADCKNAFCHGVLPEDETVIVCPPPGCPQSKKRSLWKLKKTLYGLRRLPLH